MKYEKYLIKKGKIDLLSSLKSLDKKVIKEKIKEFGVDDIYELRDYILDFFEYCLESSKDDLATRMYFERLIENENSNSVPANEQDIESLFVFIYNNGEYYSYYIPTEIKNIINEMFCSMTSVEKMNLENACNTPIIKDLKDLLGTLNVNDLKDIGRLLHVNRLSNKPKKEVIDIIYCALTNKDILSDLINRFVDNEYNLLKRLMNNKGTVQDNNINMEDYHFLYVVGLVFLFRRNNKFYISMSDDVYDVIKKINLNDYSKKIDENTKVYNLAKSMIELYGAFSYSELDYYYSLYYGNGKQLEAPDDVLLFCKRLDNIDIVHVEHNMYYVHKVLQYMHLKPLLDDIILRHETIRRRPIKLEDLLKYSDFEYYEETKSKDNLKKYLKKNNISSNIIEVIIKVISDMYRLGDKFVGQAIELLQEYGLEVTKENAQEILNYLTDIYNNSRIWLNNGWTPIEMRKEYK